MPAYEYKCPSCQQKHTETRGINEQEKIKQCENCKVDYVRVFAVPVVTFNGSGFHINDKKDN
jgi:putative FmdB family regulatory protein